MLAMSLLQEAPNTNLAWLFYVLLVFLLLVIIVGALTSREKKESSAPKPEEKLDEPASRPKAPIKTKRPSLRKRSK